MYITTTQKNVKGLERCDELQGTENFDGFSELTVILRHLIILVETWNGAIYCSQDYQAELTPKKK